MEAGPKVNHRNIILQKIMENMQNAQGMPGSKMVCKCPHHKVVPILVVLFGLTFLLGALHIFSAGVVAVLWPLILIVGGLFKMTSKSCKCC
jgi:hypothetical protein